MPHEIDEIRMPIAEVDNERYRTDPKDVLNHLNPRSASVERLWRWSQPGAGIILKVVPTRAVPLTMPLSHETSRICSNLVYQELIAY